MEINTTKKDDDRERIKKKSPPNIVKRGFTWRPVPTILSTTMCFMITGIVFLIVGAVLIYMTSKIEEFVIRYDKLSDCESALTNSSSRTCTINIILEGTFYPPVMVYYQLENFYQVIEGTSSLSPCLN